MIGWIDFILLFLASFRLTRLLVYDRITAFIRRPFHREAEEVLPDGSKLSYIEIKGTGLQKWIGELLSCYWCTGIWTSAFLYFIFIYMTDQAAPLILILAIAGCAAILESIIEKLTF
ncbi:DUF1360 domain-containing protein [Metabacillus idriensis]|uniref:DUF1360 domain-containing protein n=1 Tax=Metabacillus idriensis TaxID=324768 RepID=A0A6I2M7E2_9BACI|nr:DUF1360 domain-containing protein [Metabacillus idriensis]MCM3595186.1 DUF1360 domain-containing protein [Metabacillus idriensis]MRX52786.1 DUF1360 domain-containing protein [Metabacillus idriensis]OHR74387.1 sporulation protein [Bacillus sp. HMSC76G11]